MIVNSGSGIKIAIPAEAPAQKECIGKRVYRNGPGRGICGAAKSSRPLVTAIRPQLDQKSVFRAGRGAEVAAPGVEIDRVGENSVAIRIAPRIHRHGPHIVVAGAAPAFAP